MNYKIHFSPGLIFLTLLCFTILSCQKDDDDGDQFTGNVNLEITDGPSDDANVKGVFVTVADVKIDGKSWEGFAGKTTFDLAAYHDGQVKSLGNGDLETGSYSNITLVLDNERDANGNSPGCYVLTTGDEKKSLSSDQTTEITVSKNFQSQSDRTNNLVVDFDLRKAIIYENSTMEDYRFVTQSELQNSVRVVQKGESGTVKGKCTDAVTSSDKIVVYAYQKGSFNRTVEMQGQGASEIYFKNAVASDAVDENRNYRISFLESGDYELHFVSYKDTNNDGSLEITGSLLINLIGGANLNTVSITSGATLTLDVDVTGLLPL